jgi:glucose/arabinose dehydrogenase
MTRSSSFVAAVLAACSLSVVVAAGAQSAAAPQAAQAKPTAAPIPDIDLARVLPKLETIRPVQMIQLPTDESLWYLIEQPGNIRLVDMRSDVAQAPIVVDLRDRVNDRTNEEGLLSAAFHPSFPAKRELYVYYTAAKPRRSVLSRLTVSEDGRTVDPKSEVVIMEFAQPYWNHNGGTVLFGPDGKLYLSLGDGGAANDPHDYGQNMKSHLGKVIRIDVDTKDEGKQYSVPKDNPFVGKEGVLPEIWASGTRNIWRMHFDRVTGDLWAGDVGQNAWEEISIIVKGGNFGWNRREGFHAFTSESKEGFIDPVVDYSHKEGISVTGGFVYRPSKDNTAIPGLEGTYLYADFAIPKIWGIRLVDGKATEPRLLVQKPGSLISSFAEAKDGTLYVLTFEGGQNQGQKGAIWRIVAKR